jgi:hypothetical protein
MAHTLKPSEAVRPPDWAIYAAWEDIDYALRNVMRQHPPEVVRWLAEHAEGNDAVVEAAEAHLEVTGE